MLLSISDDKIRQEMEKVDRVYTVSVGYLEPGYDNTIPIPSGTAQSAINVLPPDLEKEREQLMALRQSAIDAGMRPLSFDDLDKLIDEIRGR
jgi:hypothetical protein